MLPVNVSTYLARGGDKALIWKQADAKWEYKFYYRLSQQERVTYSVVGQACKQPRFPKVKGVLAPWTGSIFMIHICTRAVIIIIY